MTDKRYLKRRRKLNAYIFEARITERDTQSSIAADLLDRVFKGSAADMMLHLLEDKKISPQEHQQLLDLIQQHHRESNS
jgi:predicted transcriptional regulator